MKEVLECEGCGREDGMHFCHDCNSEISEEECYENKGLCDQCLWLLDK